MGLSNLRKAVQASKVTPPRSPAPAPAPAPEPEPESEPKPDSTPTPDAAAAPAAAPAPEPEPAAEPKPEPKSEPKDSPTPGLTEVDRFATSEQVFEEPETSEQPAAAPRPTYGAAFSGALKGRTPQEEMDIRAARAQAAEPKDTPADKLARVAEIRKKQAEILGKARDDARKYELSMMAPADRRAESAVGEGRLGESEQEQPMTQAEFLAAYRRNKLGEIIQARTPLLAMLPTISDNPRTAQAYAEQDAELLRASKGRGFVAAPSIPSEVANDPESTQKSLRRVRDELEVLRAYREDMEEGYAGRPGVAQVMSTEKAELARMDGTPLVELRDRARREMRGTDFYDVVFDDATPQTRERYKREQEQARAQNPETRQYIEDVKEYDLLQDRIAALAEIERMLLAVRKQQKARE